jgi:transcriptional regulator with XRE-family HTH domain
MTSTELDEPCEEAACSSPDVALMNGKAMTDLQRIGKKMRDRREQLKLSQARLAELVDTQQPQIKSWETGERPVPVDWAKLIAPVLGFHPAELLLPPELLTPDMIAPPVIASANQNKIPLHNLIENRARTDGDYAIAFALLKLADVLGQVACSHQPVYQAIDPYPLRVSHTGKEGSA